MKQKHTPGPWMFDDGVIFKNEITVLQEGDFPSTVATIHRDNVTSRANAHLISSAPEMYAALKALAGFSLTAHVAFNFYGGEDLSLREIIDRAIAHAEGREIGMEVEA